MVRRSPPAENALGTLQAEIDTFEAKLDDQHEVAIRVSGSSSLIHVRTIRFDSPDMLIFEGLTSDREETIAIQHVAQLNLQLVKVAKLQATAFRVGFVHPTE